MQRRKLGEEIVRYADAVPAKSKSVGITLRYPTFSDLTPDQLGYYLYWRTTVGTDSFRKAADGYCWLLVCELINSTDSEKGSELLNALCTSSANDGDPYYPYILSAAVEYSVVNGTEMPEYSEWMSSEESCEYFSRAMCTPVSDLSRPFISKFITDIGREELSDPDLPRRFGALLRAYDDILQENDIGTIRETFGSPVKESFLPFGGFVHLSGKIPLEKIAWKPDCRRFGTLMEMVWKLISGRAVTPAGIPMAEEFIAKAREILRNPPARETLPLFSKKEGVLYRVLGTPCTKYGPSRFCDTQAGSGRSIVTLGDILTYGPMLPTVAAEYVTSDLEHPAYSDLSPEQTAYFLRWKQEFKRGNYLDTDNGYLNLFITELINNDKGKETGETLVKLQKVYGDGESNPLNRILLDHSLANGKTFTDFRIYMDRWVINNWIDSFVCGVNTVPLDHKILDIMRTGSPSAAFMDRSVPLEPFEKAMKRIFRELSSRSDLDSALGLKVTNARRQLYFGFDYLRGQKERNVTFADYLGCRKFIHLMDRAAQYMSDLRENLSKPKALTFGRVSCGSILAEEYLIWNMKNTKVEEKKFELDLEAVSRAEDDLSQVTEMMRVEEEETKTGKPVETVAEDHTLPAPAEGPWVVFFGTLSDGETEYLRRMVVDDSDVKEFLKTIGMTKIKIEDSINNKALDSVGDNVIEGGELIEDYLEEIKTGLKW